MGRYANDINRKLKHKTMNTPLENLIEYIEEWQPKNKHTEGIWSKAKQLLFEERELIEKIYLDGFKKYAEGYNGEYPFEGESDIKIYNDIKPNDYFTKKFR